MNREIIERTLLKNSIINDALILHNQAIQILSDTLQTVNTYGINQDRLYEARSNLDLLKKQLCNYSKSKAGVQLASEYG